MSGLDTFRVGGLAQDIARTNPGELNDFALVQPTGGNRLEGISEGGVGRVALAE